MIPTLEGIEENKNIESIYIGTKLKVKKGLECISKLTSLKSINLDKLDQKIPANFLTPLVNLDSLTLGANLDLIAEIPTNIRELIIRHDSLAQLPNWNPNNNVEQLIVGDNSCKFETLNSLKCLPKLKGISLISPKTLNDIGYLENYPDLEELNLNFAPISDLSALKNLTQLKVFKARGSQISDMGPLYQNKELKTLFLEKSKLTSIQGIGEHLPNLELLWIWGTKVKDLMPLKGMTNLHNLDLTLLKPKDWTFLPSLTGLEVLDLRETNFEDISLISELPKLRRVRLVETKVDTTAKEFVAFDSMMQERGGEVVME